MKCPNCKNDDDDTMWEDNLYFGCKKCGFSNNGLDRSGYFKKVAHDRGEAAAQREFRRLTTVSVVNTTTGRKVGEISS